MPGFLIHRNYEIINVCICEPLNLGVTCSIEINNQYNLYFSTYHNLTCLILLESSLRFKGFDSHGQKSFLAHTKYPVSSTQQGVSDTILTQESHA